MRTATSIAKTFADHHANCSVNILLRDAGSFPPISRTLLVNCPARTGLIHRKLPECFTHRQLACFATCCVDITGNCPVIRERLHQPLCGRCSALGETCPATDRIRFVIRPAITQMINQTLRRCFAGCCAAAARLAALFLIRGWCLTKIPAFQFQKAAKDSVRLNISN